MNSIKSLRTTAVAIALVMVGAAVIAPTATAQESSLSFGTATVSYDGSSNLAPDTGKATVKFTWEYEIPSPVYGPSAGAQATSTLLTFTSTPCDNGQLKVAGAKTIPVRLVDNSNQPKSSDDGEATFIVTATQLAPGETEIQCHFKGSVAGTGSVQKSNEPQADVGIVVNYLGLISANIPTTIQQAGPQKQIKYDIEVKNLGNSLSNIRFELRDAEAAAAGGWNPVAPTPVVLQSEAQGGSDTTNTVSFLISTPFKNGWNNKEKTFTLDITPESTKNPDAKGSTVTVNVLARVRGVYVPSLEPMVMVGAVIGSAMIARLARKE